MELGLFPGKEIIYEQVQKHKKHGGFWELQIVWHGGGGGAFEVAAKSEGGEGLRQSVKEEVMRSLGFIPG